MVTGGHTDDDIVVSLGLDASKVYDRHGCKRKKSAVEGVRFEVFMGGDEG